MFRMNSNYKYIVTLRNIGEGPSYNYRVASCGSLRDALQATEQFTTTRCRMYTQVKLTESQLNGIFDKMSKGKIMLTREEKGNCEVLLSRI